MTELEKWAADAPDGASFIYGFMDGEKRPRQAAMQCAAKLHIAGIVTLVQRREPDGSIAYIAQRTHAPVRT